MRCQPPTFTKEKAVFLVVALFCAALMYSFLASGPIELKPGKQLAFSKRDPALLTSRSQDLRDESAYFAGERKSPFVLSNPIIIPPPPGTTGPTPVGTGPAAGAGTGIKATTHSPQKLYEFAGVVVHEGSAHALLQVRGKSVTIRAEVGSVLDGGYSVTRVNKQSIELRNTNGQLYLLRDRAD